MKKILLFFFLIMPLSVLSKSQLNPVNYVSDFAQILKQEEEDSLNVKLSEFKQSTDIEIAIVTVNSLINEEIEVFANNLFSEWGIGLKGADNGLLCLIAPNERKWRIEVGYGLEPFMTDYDSYNIGSKNFNKNFISEDYFIGLNGFINDVIKELGEMTWDERISLKERNRQIMLSKISNILDVLFFIFISLIIIALIILGVISINKKIKNKEFLKKYKLDKIEEYKTYVYGINLILKSVGLKEIDINKKVIELLNKVKNKELVEYNFLLGMNDISDYKNLVDTIERINKKINETDVLYKKMQLLEKSLTNETTKEVLFSIEFKNDINYLYSVEETIDKQIELYNKRHKILEEFKFLLNYTHNDVDYVFSMIENKYSNKQFKPEDEKIRELKVRIKSSIENFKNIPKNFTFFDELKKYYDEYLRINSELNFYLLAIDTNNSKYESMISTIKQSKNVLSDFSGQLYQYSCHSYISYSTKIKINEFNELVNNFKITNNEYETYENYLDICKKFQTVKELCESEKRKHDDYERNKRNYSNNTYGHSYGSSNSSFGSSSSFGGFGGGMSGGGGASGGW